MHLQDLLPAAVSALSRLLRLECLSLDLFDFPDEIAAALKSLQHLDLSGNCFHRFPSALSQCTSLQQIVLKDNNHLQFEEDDFEILQALPLLVELHVSKHPGVCQVSPWNDALPVWTESSVRFLFAIRDRFPRVKLCL